MKLIKLKLIFIFSKLIYLAITRYLHPIKVIFLFFLYQILYPRTRVHLFINNLKKIIEILNTVIIIEIHLIRILEH